MEKQKKIWLFNLAAFSIIATIAFLIVREYAIPVLQALLLAYVFLPVKNFLDRKLPERASSLIILFVILAMLVAGVYFFSTEFYGQINGYLNREGAEGIFSEVIRRFNWLPQQAQDYLLQLRQQANNLLVSLAVSFVSALPRAALSLFMTFFIAYYFLLDFDSMRQFFLQKTPFKNRRNLAEKIGKTAKKIIYGYSAIALIEFFVALAGFYLAGSPVYLVLALIVGLSAFVPGIGPITVWVPAFLFYLFQQDYYPAIIILATGLIITGVIDNFLGFILVGKGSGIHPVVMFLGVLGGVPLFGIFGFILGPLALIIFIESAKDFMASSAP